VCTTSVHGAADAFVRPAERSEAEPGKSADTMIFWRPENMTANDFRRLALDLPEVVENAHMDHPDFRVGGKVFATLGHPATDWGMVKLTAEQQHYLSKDNPDVFVPVKGAWGRQGATSVMLKAADKKTLVKALRAAWMNTAPKRLVKQYAFDEK
jgi:hypothetical protein